MDTMGDGTNQSVMNGIIKLFDKVYTVYFIHIESTHRHSKLYTYKPSENCEIKHNI